MTRVPEEYRSRLSGFPPELRALLEAELEAGNGIVEVASCFPAPPAGVYVKLARPVTTRPRRSGGGVSFHDRRSSLCSGEFCDERRFHFVLEPPLPPEPEPDMDAIRSARASPMAPAAAPAGPPAGDAVARFKASMAIDYGKWHDGIGYDLEALRGASAEERARIEEILLSHGVSGWRDVEALAALRTPRAVAALRRASASPDAEIRLAVLSHAPELVPEPDRTASLVAALKDAEFHGGLTEALDEVEAHHPPAVVEALFRGALARDGEIAVHFAAMLAYLHGKAAEPFDWTQRPFFLRFHTVDRREREAAFRDLCAKLGVDASVYL